LIADTEFFNDEEIQVDFIHDDYIYADIHYTPTKNILPWKIYPLLQSYHLWTTKLHMEKWTREKIFNLPILILIEEMRYNFVLTESDIFKRIELEITLLSHLIPSSEKISFSWLRNLKKMVHWNKGTCLGLIRFWLLLFEKIILIV
jgi:hypothetical protein